MIRPRLFEHISSLIVVTLTSAFATVLILAIRVVENMMDGSGLSEAFETVVIMLSVLIILFVGIALYVSGVVITNAFSTLIAGRRKEIALLRLIGSTAKQQRAAVLKEGFTVGIIGAITGYLIGLGGMFAALQITIQLGYIQDWNFQLLTPLPAVPLMFVVLVTALAAWVGSRRVLTVTPIEAVSQAQPASLEQLRSNSGRFWAMLVMLILGMVFLGGGVLVGLVNPAGVLIAFLGGVFSFTGIIIGSVLLLPSAMAFVGKLMNRGVSGRLAVANSKRYPERSARVMLALVIGVTLVVMFAVASESLQAAIRSDLTPEQAIAMTEVMNIVVMVFSSLLGFSAVLAAIGTANTISLNVLQRTREFGLLRALGLSREQLRNMIRVESALLALTGIVLGIVLGTFYGWVGAQSFVASTLNDDPKIVPLELPWILIGLLVVSALLLIWVSSAAPSRRALKLAPVQALAEA